MFALAAGAQASDASGQPQVSQASAQGSAAAPQSSPPANAGPVGRELEEVVVTAQFRQQTAQSTPISISAISAATLEARGDVSVDQLSADEPNVVLEDAPHPFGPALQAFIRGIGQSDFNYAFEPGVGMYVDDVYYSTLTGSIFDLLDLDHVEVLRGPQGTLDGMNSIGGAVKLYSREPTDNSDAFVEGTYGSYSLVDVRAGTNFTLAPDRLFVRISGVSRHQDGYVTRYDYACTHPGAPVPTAVIDSDCVLGTEGGTAYDAVRAIVRWIATDKLEVHLIADDTNDNSEASPATLLYVGQGNGAPGVPATYPQFSTAPVGGLPLGTPSGSPFISYSPFGPYARDTFSSSPYINYSTYCDNKPPDGTAPFCVPAVQQVSGYGFSGTLDYTFNDQLSLKSITAYRDYDANWSFDTAAAPVSDGLEYDAVEHHQLSEEVRLTGSLFESAVNWTLGGFYFDQKTHFGSRVDLGSEEFVEDDEIPATDRATFLNVGWRIVPKLELNAGVRYTEENKTFEFGRSGVPGTPVSALYAPCPQAGGVVMLVLVCPLNGIRGYFSGSKVDYRAALQYQWTDELMTYASVSTGFKGGGVNPRPFVPAQVIPFGDETVTAYEVGLKSDWLDHRVRVNLAAFWNKYDGIQVTVNNCSFIAGEPSFFPCAAVLNSGDANVRGIELETEGHPTEALSFDASASYLDFGYTSLNPFAVDAGVEPWMTTPYAPRWKYSAGVQYEIRLGSKAGSITPRLDLSYQDSFFSEPENSIFNKVPAYTLLNGHLTWRPSNENWRVILEVKNIANKLYYTGIYDSLSTNNVVTGTPGPPREWDLTVKRTF